MRYGIRKPLCIPLGLQSPEAVLPDCLQPWCGAHAWPIWPIPSEVRQPSPLLVLPTLSPFTQLLIAVHKEMLANTFYHLYLLAGKLKDFSGPETDIQTSNQILFVFGWGGPCLGFRKYMQQITCWSCPPGWGGNYINRTAILLDLAKVANELK